MVFLALCPVGSVSLGSFVLLGHLAVLMASTLAVGCWLGGFLGRAIGVVGFAGPFLGFVGDAVVWCHEFWVGLESLLRHGLSEPGFYGGLVCGLGKIVGSGGFSARFIRVISHCGRVGCGIAVLQQTACLVVSLVMVGSFAFLFDCVRVGRT